MADKEDLRWGIARRFELIEWRAYWLGRINRSDLEESFGVSTTQASTDLRTYQEAAPNNIVYDSTEKAYVPTSTFQPKYLRVSADRYLLQLGAILNGAISIADTWFSSPPPATVVQTLARPVEPTTLRSMLRAITGRLEIDMEYQSFTNTRQRAIAPHSLAFDGHRWHVRAWCVDSAEFRDFVLSRILSVGDDRNSNADPTHDVEWNTMIQLQVIAHPELTDAHKSVIERDFGMKDGLLTITTRAALAFYFIRRLNLDLGADCLAPERLQIYLRNKDEVEALIQVAKQKSQVLISGKNPEDA